MLYQKFETLYNQFRLRHYQSLFSRIHERSGRLSATESYSLDTIHLLGTPTIKQFAEVLGISQPNATYKVNGLEAKGYIKRMPSGEDKRECRLAVDERFYKYYGAGYGFLQQALEGLTERSTPEELASFETMLVRLSEIMGEDRHGSFQ
ncbi:MAG: MarR family transcriptional regulator [Clostridiales bacterium]|nr:MarR family transcriptional regulator [Clostridiales bacterium]